jgi:methylmalonyl-CoA decarboxylase
MSLVLTEVENNIGTITLNSPEKHNALSHALIADFMAALEQMKSSDVRAVILRAPKGSRIWCAGHDIHELEASGHDPLPYSDPLRRAVRAIERFPHPIIALIEGGVWGGGCEIVASCDLLVATPNSTFAITPAKLAVAYNLDGVLNFMKSVGLPFLREMLFTASPVTAERALHFGLINYVVPAEEIEAFTVKLAQQIAQNSPLGVSLLKEELRILAEAHPLTPEAFERMQQLRRTLYGSEDYQEGIRSFLEKRKPQFKGK